MLKKTIITNIILTMGNILLKFGLNIYLANNFREVDIVKYFILIDVVTIISMFFAGFKDSLIRAISVEKQGVYQYFIKKILLVSFIVFIILIPLIYYFNNLYEFYNIQYSIFELEAILFLFIANMLLVQVLLSNRIFNIVSYVEFLKGFLFVMIFFIFLYLFQFSIDSVYENLIVSFVVTNILLIFFLAYNINKYILKKSFLFLKKEAHSSNIIPIGRQQKITISIFYTSFEYFIATLPLYLSSILLLALYGNATIGDFQVVARPIYFALISIFSYPIFRFLLPEFSSIVKNKNFKRILDIRKKFNYAIIVFSILLIGLTLLFAEYVIAMLFPKEYSESYSYLVVLVFSIPFVVYTSFLFSIIKSFDYFKDTFYIRLFGLFTFVTSFLICLDIDKGEISIVYSIFFSSISMFTYAYILEKRIMNNV